MHASASGLQLDGGFPGRVDGAVDAVHSAGIADHFDAEACAAQLVGNWCGAGGAVRLDHRVDLGALRLAVHRELRGLFSDAVHRGVAVDLHAVGHVVLDRGPAARHGQRQVLPKTLVRSCWMLWKPGSTPQETSICSEPTASRQVAWCSRASNLPALTRQVMLNSGSSCLAGKS